MLLVCNPAAGRRGASGAVTELRRVLAVAGVDAEPLLTRGCWDAGEVVSERLAERPDAVLVCGGDGTVGQVAGAVAGSGVPLGILPYGTSNVLAWECGLPPSPRAALEVLLRGASPRAFRTWRCGTRTMLLGMGVGYDARLMRSAGPRLKRWLGTAGVALAGLAQALSYDFPALAVSGEDEHGERFRHAATFLLAGNASRYAGRWPMTHDGDPGDDLLEAVLFRSSSRRELFRFWKAICRPGARHLEVAGVRVLRARSLEVSTPGGAPEEVHVNGDWVGRTPVTLEPAAPVLLLSRAA